MFRKLVAAGTSMPSLEDATPEKAPIKKQKPEPTVSAEGEARIPHVAVKSEEAAVAGIEADNTGVQEVGEENLAKQAEGPVMPGEDLLPVPASARTRRRYVRTLLDSAPTVG